MKPPEGRINNQILGVLRVKPAHKLSLGRGGWGLCMGKELREDMRQSLQCCLIRLILPPETLVVCQKDHLWELADCSFTLALNSQK